LLLVASSATAPLAAPALAAAFATALVVLLAAQPPASRFLRPLAGALLAIAALLVPLVLAGRGADAAWLAARSLATAVIALGCASSLSLAELGGALAALGLPAALASVIVTMLRQLAAVHAQAKNLLLARKLRGAAGIELGGEMLATLFARTAERAERAELAARLRGHELLSARRRAGFTLRDVPLVLVALVVAAAPHVVGAVA
jgi:energy-coupling factor transporter transmembrane protein EcfT